MALAAAVLPTLIEGLTSDPTARIQPLVVALRRASGVDYVTVMDLQNRRVAHTNPALIGAPPATDHTGVRAGQEFVGVEVGPTGRTFHVRVPMRDQAGTIVGTLSIGIAEHRLTSDGHPRRVRAPADRLRACARSTARRGGDGFAEPGGHRRPTDARGVPPEAEGTVIDHAPWSST